MSFFCLGERGPCAGQHCLRVWQPAASLPHHGLQQPGTEPPILPAGPRSANWARIMRFLKVFDRITKAKTFSEKAFTIDDEIIDNF